jgi:hypothetical protein
LLKKNCIFTWYDLICNTENEKGKTKNEKPNQHKVKTKILIGSTYLFDLEKQIEAILQQDLFNECIIYTSFSEDAHQIYPKNVITKVFE